MIQATAILAMAQFALAGKDYYRILGIQKNANQNQIKKGYRKMSMKWHPDKNQDNKEQAQKNMLDINRAYEVLSDPEKKVRYDKFGEEGVDKDPEPAFQAPDIGINLEELLRNAKFGNGQFGNAQFNTRMRGSGVSLKGLENVEELSEKLFKAKFEGPESERRSLVVVFYTAGCSECEELREAFKEFGEKIAGAGLVEVASVNCAREKSLCQEEAGGVSRPVVNYYGPGADGQKAKRHPAGAVSFKSLSIWYPRIMADFCTILPDLGAVREWLTSNDKVPHAIFFSDKKSTPPLIKKLAIEFNHRAAIGVVLAGAETEVATRFGVESRPALLHVLDEDSFDSDRFDQDFKKVAMINFLSRSIGKHRKLAESALRELTPSRFRNGDCSPNDSNFCVLLLRPTAGASGASARDAFRQLARHFAKDPLKVFIVRHAGFASAFGKGFGKVVLFRPKRKTYKVFNGTGSAEDLIAFADAAIGGSPLPESLSESPVMQEL
jgi:curved DNA-binding protein CbpA